LSKCIAASAIAAVCRYNWWYITVKYISGKYQHVVKILTDSFVLNQ